MKTLSNRYGQVPAISRGEETTRILRLSRWYSRTRVTFVVSVLLVVSVLRFGGRILVVADPLPEHADAAIVLNGSYAGVAARRAEAMRLLEEGRVAHVMLSVGAISYYGEWLPDLVARFVQQEYGDTLAERVVICEGLGDSTVDEMADLRRCLESTEWQSAVIVTSDYHTRRTSMILRSTLAEQTSVQRLTVHGVADGSFVSRGWWRRRTYAKTWLLETTKLLWFFVERLLPGGAV